MCNRMSDKPPGNAINQLMQRLFDPARPAKITGPEENHAASPPLVRRRLKLWELEIKYHCPVIGTCLSLDELKKIARKEGFLDKTFDHYRLHGEAVSASGTRNSTSSALHKLLEQKHARWIKIFESAKTDEAVHQLWQDHLAQGEVAGPLWAAVTHKAIGPKTGDQIYGDIHMLSHQIGAGLAADVRRLGYLETEVTRLQQAVNEHQSQSRRIQAERTATLTEITAENQRLTQTLRGLPELKARVETWESGQLMEEMRRQQFMLEIANAQLEAALHNAQQRLEPLAQLTSKNQQLHTELMALTKERDTLERLLLSDAEDCCDQCQCEDEQLKGRCILCVGGRTALLPQYRELAERLGVRLIHHDGGQEEALSRLPDLLAASDAVICPTDCVSHTAYYQLKRHCKLYQKPCVLTKNSGVSGFATALSQLAEGTAHIWPQ